MSGKLYRIKDETLPALGEALLYAGVPGGAENPLTIENAPQALKDAVDRSREAHESEKASLNSIIAERESTILQTVLQNKQTIAGFADRSIRSVVIPDGVTSIGPYAFIQCRELESVVIPGSVTIIGNYAFGACLKLSSVSLPEGVISLGDYAFNGCAFESIALPSVLQTIGKNAFQGTRLKNIDIPRSVTGIASDAFANCSSLTDIYVPWIAGNYDDFRSEAPWGATKATVHYAPSQPGVIYTGDMEFLDGNGYLGLYPNCGSELYGTYLLYMDLTDTWYEVNLKSVGTDIFLQTGLDAEKLISDYDNFGTVSIVIKEASE